MTSTDYTVEKKLEMLETIDISKANRPASSFNTDNPLLSTSGNNRDSVIRKLKLKQNQGDENSFSLRISRQQSSRDSVYEENIVRLDVVTRNADLLGISTIKTIEEKMGSIVYLWSLVDAKEYALVDVYLKELGIDLVDRCKFLAGWC
jgi:hypothetical protein